MRTTASPRAQSSPAVMAAACPKLRESWRSLTRGSSAWASSMRAALRSRLPSSTNQASAPPGSSSITCRRRARSRGRTWASLKTGTTIETKGSGRSALTRVRRPDHGVPGEPPHEGQAQQHVVEALQGREPPADPVGVLVEDALPVAVGVGVDAVDHVVLDEEQESGEPELPVSHAREVTPKQVEDVESQRVLVDRSHPGGHAPVHVDDGVVGQGIPEDAPSAGGERPPHRGQGAVEVGHVVEEVGAVDDVELSSGDLEALDGGGHGLEGDAVGPGRLLAELAHLGADVGGGHACPAQGEVRRRLPEPRAQVQHTPPLQIAQEAEDESVLGGGQGLESRPDTDLGGPGVGGPAVVKAPLAVEDALTCLGGHGRGDHSAPPRAGAIVSPAGAGSPPGC